MYRFMYIYIYINDNVRNNKEGLIFLRVVCTVSNSILAQVILKETLQNFATLMCWN